MSEQANRPRGILTPPDRELLRGEIEYENPQQYSNRRADIRERIANGLMDFSLIQYLLRDKDRKLIFKDPSSQANVDNLDLPANIQSTIFWIYLGLKEQNYDFERLIEAAVEEAEKEYASKYWGEKIDVSVTFSVEVHRSYEIEDIITKLERGGPIKAKYIYDLLQLSNGVPIDTQQLDVINVYFQSSYIEGEKDVLETIFSEYLGVEVEIRDAEERIHPTDVGIEQNDASIDPNQPRPDPSDIKHHSGLNIDAETLDEEAEEFRRELEFLNKSAESGSRNPPEEFDSPLGSAIDDIMDSSEERDPSIYTIIDQKGAGTSFDQMSTPENIKKLMELVSDPFVSTSDIALAMGCAHEAAKTGLGELFENGAVRKDFVLDEQGEQVIIWWLSEDR